MIKATSGQAGQFDRMLRDLARPSLEVGRAVWDGYVAMLRDMARAPTARPCSPCEIPEQDCPPRCVCELGWQGQPRDTLRGTIRVTNTGRDRRTFTFAATSLTSDGHDAGIKPQVEPTSAVLDPQQSVTLQVAIPLSQGFETGRTYRGEVLIRGVWEQCVKLSARVEAEPRPHCDVDQGEMPRRVRAHHWYDHFQCEEPCFEPVRHAPRDDDDDPPRPVG